MTTATTDGRRRPHRFWKQPVRLAGLAVASVSVASCAPSTAMRNQPTLGVAGSAMENGAPDFALRIAQTAIARDPRNVSAWISQGDAYAAMNNPFQATASYKKALALQPASTGARMGLGRLSLHSNPSEAAGWFDQVLAMQPQNPAALNDAAIARDLLGQHASAQDDYRRALTAQPDLAAAQVNLGLSLAVSGRAQDGALLIQPIAMGPSGTPRMREDLATALLLAGQEQAARDTLRRDIPASQLDDAIRALRSLQVIPIAPRP